MADFDAMTERELLDHIRGCAICRVGFALIALAILTITVSALLIAMLGGR